MNIAIDLDGVLSDYICSLVAYMNANGHANLPPGYEPPDWFWSDSFPTRGDVKAIHKEAIKSSNFWLNMPDYPENVAALRDFLRRNKDYGIMFLSSRTPDRKTLAETQLWLAERSLLTAHTTVVLVDSKNDKHNIIDATRVKLFVDDCAETIETGISQGRKGYYLLERSWNKNSQLAKNNPKMVVSSLKQFLEVAG